MVKMLTRAQKKLVDYLANNDDRIVFRQLVSDKSKRVYILPKAGKRLKSTFCQSLIKQLILVKAIDQIIPDSICEYVLSASFKSKVKAEKSATKKVAKKEITPSHNEEITLIDFFARHNINLNTASGRFLLKNGAIWVNDDRIKHVSDAGLIVSDQDVITINHRILPWR